ncbi:MAG TPA: hypothetical protein VM491_19060, partial [Burkholderiaceae bacterium]|nr:hypothetical protein [Burkholderiaceae bacterium]
PGMQVEVMSWALRMAAAVPPPQPCPAAPQRRAPPAPADERALFDARTGQRQRVPLYWRFDLQPGATVEGPAIVAEEETSTLVPAGFAAHVNAVGYIVVERISGSSR